MCVYIPERLFGIGQHERPPDWLTAEPRRNPQLIKASVKEIIEVG